MQQLTTYRANFVDLTLNHYSGTIQTENRLMINMNNTTSSDWICGEIIIMNDVLDLEEIQCVENYLQTKYDYTPPIQS